MNSNAFLPPTFINNWTDRKTSEKIEYKRLGKTDLIVSTLGLGGAHVSKDLVFSADGSQLISGFEDVVQSIRKTIQSGINFIDTSSFYGYGKAEIVLGKALETIPRNAYYLATKVGRKGDCTFDFSAQSVLKSFESSLEKLGVDYLDVIHVHDVEFSDNIETVINQTLPTLDKLRQQKKVKYIGITGYPLNVLKEIIERSDVKIDAVLSYCRITPFDQKLLEYLPFFKEKGIGVINAAVLGMGLLVPNGNLPYWHPAPTPLKEACSRANIYCAQQNVNLAKISVYYALQQNGIDTHLIGMEDENALKSNLDVMVNGINQKEKQVLNEIIENIFSKLQIKDWEGIEENKYRSDPKKFAQFLLNGK